ncbi:MAG TPA: hypothetical protein DCS28_01010 [Candidatus Moranbacteria bacterium]|nr:hypothetical protein [Candidatus Moranbacteria bacterium]
MPNHKILLGLTTTPDSDWRKKIEECKKFDIQEIALFPTAIGFESRQELYRLLENSPVKNIPHVHLRNDMEKEELDYLVEKFHTQVFNIHPRKNVHPFTNDYEKHIPNIYVENSEVAPEIEELEKYGGLCVDFSHWQDAVLKNDQEHISKMQEAVGKFKIGCSHISGVGSVLEKFQDAKFPEIIYEGYSKHTLSELKELDYMKNFIQYLPELVSIELENSFEEQLKVKKYLEDLISNN